jgi:hypothetical protein
MYPMMRDANERVKARCEGLGWRQEQFYLETQTSMVVPGENDEFTVRAHFFFFASSYPPSTSLLLPRSLQLRLFPSLPASAALSHPLTAFSSLPVCVRARPFLHAAPQVYSSTQNPTKTSNFVAHVLGIPKNRVACKASATLCSFPAPSSAIADQKAASISAISMRSFALFSGRCPSYLLLTPILSAGEALRRRLRRQGDAQRAAGPPPGRRCQEARPLGTLPCPAPEFQLQPSFFPRREV